MELTFHGWQCKLPKTPPRVACHVKFSQSDAFSLVPLLCLSFVSRLEKAHFDYLQYFPIEHINTKAYSKVIRIDMFAKYDNILK